MRRCLLVPLALVAAAGALRSDPPAADGFEPPVPLLGDSEHAGGYPAFADLDGDGKLDLVVGVADRESYDGGRLLVYRNTGTAARPVYAKPTWLDATVPSARIPDG